MSTEEEDLAQSGLSCKEKNLFEAVYEGLQGLTFRKIGAINLLNFCCAVVEIC